MTWILIAVIYFKMSELKVDIKNILANRPELMNYKKKYLQLTLAI